MKHCDKCDKCALHLFCDVQIICSPPSLFDQAKSFMEWCDECKTENDDVIPTREVMVMMMALVVTMEMTTIIATIISMMMVMTKIPMMMPMMMMMVMKGKCATTMPRCRATSYVGCQSSALPCHDDLFNDDDHDDLLINLDNVTHRPIE